MQAKHQSHAEELAINAETRAGIVAEVIDGLDALMQRLADSHTPEFLEITVTMPQAKLLYLLGALGDLHMSDLVTKLRVSLSTVSGLVDRVVDQGFVTRHEDPIDRRQVVVALTPAGAGFIDHFRELNARQMRELLELLGDEDLDHVRHALGALTVAADRLAARSGSDRPITTRPDTTAGGDPA